MERSRKGSGILKWLGPGLGLGLAFCAAGAAGDDWEAGSPAVLELSAEVLDNAQLEYVEASGEGVAAAFEASGTVELNADKWFTIVPRIGGVVEDIPCAVGDTVKEGEELIRLESRELAEALMKYIEAEYQLKFAREALTRERDLLERKVSSEELLRAKELELTQAQLAHTAALQPLRLLHFDEETVHRYADHPDHAVLTWLELKSPGAGEVIARHAHPGQAVEADTVLFEVADLGELWVDFHVALDDADLIQRDEEVRVRSAISEENAEARVIYVAPVADELTRRVLARALLKNEERKWRPGTPVVVSGRGIEEKGEVSVPASAVVDLGGEQVVFVRDGEGRFRLAAIETGAGDGARVVVKAGLREGETVVSRNTAVLKAQWQMQGEE